MVEIQVLRGGGDGALVVGPPGHKGFGRDVVAEEVGVDGVEDGGDEGGEEGRGGVDGGAGGGGEGEEGGEVADAGGEGEEGGRRDVLHGWSGGGGWGGGGLGFFEGESVGVAHFG